MMTSLISLQDKDKQMKMKNKQLKQPSSNKNQIGLESKITIPFKKIRKVTPVACIHCKRAHAACDSSRPCQRCVARGHPDCCIDAGRTAKKKRRPIVFSRSIGIQTEGTNSEVGLFSQLPCLQCNERDLSFFGPQVIQPSNLSPVSLDNPVTPESSPCIIDSFLSPFDTFIEPIPSLPLPFPILSDQQFPDLLLDTPLTEAPREFELLNPEM